MTPLNPLTTDITEAAVKLDPAVRRALWVELVAAQQNDDQRLELAHIAEDTCGEPGDAPEDRQSLEEAQEWLAAAVWFGRVRPVLFLVPVGWKARRITGAQAQAQQRPRSGTGRIRDAQARPKRGGR